MCLCPDYKISFLRNILPLMYDISVYLQAGFLPCLLDEHIAFLKSKIAGKLQRTSLRKKISIDNRCQFKSYVIQIHKKSQSTDLFCNTEHNYNQIYNPSGLWLYLFAFLMSYFTPFWINYFLFVFFFFGWWYVNLLQKQHYIVSKPVEGKITSECILKVVNYTITDW